jgi:TetR/AcrR family transcriptional regulator
MGLFAERGFAGTTTREIAQAAGVTEAIIFRHFATKQDLYAAILDHSSSFTNDEKWLAEVQSHMDRNDDEGLFRLVVSSILETHRTQSRFERLMLHASLEGNELAVMHCNQIMASIGVKFEEYIARRQAAGAMRQCDPRTIIFALVGMARSFGMQKYMYTCLEPLQSDEEIADAFASILITGIRNVQNE